MNNYKDGVERPDIKQVFRKLMLEQRKNMLLSDVEEKSKAIVSNILSTTEYKNADCIYAYISTRNEVDLANLIEAAWTDGKRIAVPRVCGQDMDFYYIDSFDDLSKGNFGILEPAEHTEKADNKTALMLIPGVAYDKTGNRVGYGGGYYDRYLAKEHGHYIVAPAYEFQLVNEILTEEHDIRVDKIICESVVLSLRTTKDI